MYSVLIVDDEITIREKLPQMIDFEGCGFAVRANARNGAEAMALLPVHQPKLILLDIRMPVMDGLSFLAAIRKSEYRDTPIIVLSGYSDFTYAKQAMQYGVRAYLTKPVDEEEAQALLLEIRYELRQRERESQRAAYRKRLSALKGAFDVDSPIEPMPDYGLLHILLRNVRADYEEAHPYQILTSLMTARIGLEEDGLLRHRGFSHTFLVPMAIIQAVGGYGAFAADLQQALQHNNLDCALMLNTTSLKDPSVPFRTSLLQQLSGLALQVFYDNRYILQSAPQPPYQDDDGADDVLEGHYERLRKCLVDGQEQQALQETKGLYQHMGAKRLSLDALFQLSDRVYYLLIELMASLNGKKPGIPIISRIAWWDLPTFPDFAKWQDTLTQQIRDALTFLGQNRQMLGMGVSREMLGFVYENYRSPITLKEVAEHCHMNSAYLGRVFQKVTGTSFRQFINGLRIAEAKRLLQGTDKMIYEIAQEVGFSESSYFIAKFTRESGVSPMEFRRG